jgi:polysaccharide pyruvyl transferase WcaK-like protein
VLDRSLDRPGQISAESGTPPRILLVNHWHDDNRGDSAVTATTVGILKKRYPGCLIAVSACVHKDEDAYRSAVRHLLAEHPDVLPTLTAEGSTAPRDGHNG